MKLKFANSLLVAGLLVSAAGCFTSCKDTDEDVQNQVQDQINTLSQKYAADLATLEAEIANLKALINNGSTCNCVGLEALKVTVADIQAAIDAAKGNYGSMAERFTAIEASISQLQALSTLVTDLQNKYNNLAPLVTQALTEAQEAKLLAASLSEEALAKAQAYVDAEIAQITADINAQMNDMNARIDEVALSVSENSEAISELREQYAALVKEILNLEMNINSITVQEVTSPIIGSLNTPLDIRTSILFNYYGKSEADAKLPNFRPTGNNYGYNTPAADKNGLISKQEEALLLNPAAVTVNAGQIYMSDNGEFGKVYFTANPTKVDLTNGYTLALTNSQGEPVNVKLTNIQPSDHVINFGISRADEVSLWEADAIVTTDDVESLKIEVADGLKSALKDMVLNRTLSSVADMTKLVYLTLNNNSSMPALGLQIGWNDADNVARTAYSEFNIAATTFSPLSFSTLAGQSFGDKLPVLPDFDEFVLKTTDRINAYFDNTLANKLHVEITLDKEFDLEVLNLSLTFSTTDITVTYVDPNTNIEHTVVVDSDNELVNAINEVLFEVNGYTVNVQNAVSEYFTELIENINTEINSTREDALNSLQQQITGKFESITNRISKFYTLFEKAYNKVHQFMEDPNHFMQVWMLYSVPNSPTLNRLSRSAAVPTRFVGEGNAVNLVATTYNGDLLTPSYKKYVAVTNVYYENRRDISAASGDPACVAAMERANSNLYMNQVFNGENKLVPFEFLHGYNFTYEIFYQALDFRGNTSTQKFYVNVK